MSPEAAATAGAPVDGQPGSAVGRAIRALFSFRAMPAAGLAMVVVVTIANRFNDPDLWFHLKLLQSSFAKHTVSESQECAHRLKTY